MKSHINYYRQIPKSCLILSNFEIFRIFKIIKLSIKH